MKQVGLTSQEIGQVIQVSIIGGVVFIVLFGIFLYYKGSQMYRLIQKHKYEKIRWKDRKTKFVPVPQ